MDRFKRLMSKLDGAARLVYVFLLRNRRGIAARAAVLCLESMISMSSEALRGEIRGARCIRQTDGQTDRHLFLTRGRELRTRSRRSEVVSLQSCYKELQCCAAQYRSVQISTVQYGVVLYDAVQYTAVKYCGVKTVQYRTVQHNTI